MEFLRFFNSPIPTLSICTLNDIMIIVTIMSNYSFLDLIDAGRIKRIMESFYELTGIPSALIDLKGNFLSTKEGEELVIGWQEICHDFHRVNPETLEKCVESDTTLSNILKAGERYSCYECFNGLIDMAVPIYVGGEHLANLFTGQFFFEEPDKEFFRKQSQKYGFNEEKYLKALSKVPVFSKEYVDEGLQFLTELAGMIGEMGLRQKQLLEAYDIVKKSEDNLFKTIISIPVPIGIYDLQTTVVIMVNDEFTKIMGYTREDIQNDVDWWKLLLPDEEAQKRFQKEWLQRREKIKVTGEDMEPLELEVTTRDGEKRQVIFYMRLLNGEAVVTMADFTEIHQAQEKLRENYQEQKIISEAVIRLTTVKSEDGVARILKDAVKKLLPRAYTGITFLKTYGEHVRLEKILGMENNLEPIMKFGIDLHNIDFPLGQTQILEENRVGKLKLAPDGIYGLSERKIPKNVSQSVEKILGIGEIYSIIFNWGGSHYGGFFIALRRDQDLKHKQTIETIAQQAFIAIQSIRAEEALKKSVKEKEVLIQEIHHRVKNNMQIISSLLSLQKKHVQTEETLDILTESQNRVKTLAMIHEKLYLSSNLSNIDFKDYVEGLMTDLFYSYSVKGNIKPVLHLEDVHMSLDTAIPCGLIINELVSNSLKHAFSEGTEGFISIEFKSYKDGFLLKVADNGVGIPPNIHPKSADTLGLQLIYGLVSQLEGSIDLDRTNGTQFTIKFKEIRYKERM